MSSSKSPRDLAPAPETFKDFIRTMDESEFNRWARFYDFVKPRVDPRSFWQYLQENEGVAATAKMPEGGNGKVVKSCNQNIKLIITEDKRYFFECAFFSIMQVVAILGGPQKTGSGKP